ncbi:hypothetical protein BDF19DRAFT_425294 [Syncephalis fuscata]|nr:hypothetical protein BDF19DRAFT_425294 [Syncephalis fuscata]
MTSAPVTTELYTPSPGDRVCIDDRLGTIRYYGPLTNQTGEWVGVEWDNPAWGKHSGALNGQTYFTCRVPNSGSFVRRTKLPPRVSFLEALRERYTQFGSAEHDVKWTFNNSSTIIETVGWDKINKQQSQLDKLKIVGLSMQNIIRADPAGEIAQIAPIIADLDLSSNLFNHWDVVASICSELVHLTELKLNGNRFEPLLPDTIFSTAFSHIQHMGLTNTQVSWSQACILGRSLPQLTTLMLGDNGISTLDTDVQTVLEIFPNLKTLALDENNLTSWKDIACLAQLPCLTNLNLNGNQIDTLADIPCDGFLRISNLSLQGNRLNDEKMLDYLNRLPALDYISLKDNPIATNMSVIDFRTLGVARLGRIIKFNGSEVDSKERNNCERYYLNKTALEFPMVNNKSKDEERTRYFSRYKALCKIHGPPNENQAPAPTKLQDRLLQVTISLRHSHDGDSIKTINQRLLGSSLVRNLKNILQRLLGVAAHRQKIYRLTKAADGDNTLWVELDNDLREVKFFQVQSGDTLVVITDIA